MMPMFKKILVGYDGSKGGKAALERAAVAAKHYNAELTALWVRQPLPRHADLPGEPEGEAEASRTISSNDCRLVGLLNCRWNSGEEQMPA